MDVRDREATLLDLQHADEEIRRLAVERLAALEAEVALPRLVACLGDPGWRVRKAAVERLALAPREWPVAEALIGALSDGENPGRRNAAVEALIRCGDSMLEPLLEASRSRDVDVRKLAVDTLSGIADARAVPRLLEMLEDEDTNVRAAAADALGAIGDLGEAPALLAVATRRGDDRLVALSALRALARLEAPVSAAELGAVLEDPLLRPAAYAVLGRVEDDEAAAEILLKGLGAGSRSAREAAVEALLRLVGRQDAAGAERLAERIRNAADDRLVQDGIDRLQTADLAARLELIQLFGLLGRGETVVPILLAGRDEALAEVALATLESLGATSEEAFEDVWPELDAEARRLACQAMARTGGDLGRARLLACLDEPDAGLRAAAAEALGARRCAEALPPLLRRLEAVAAAREDDYELEDELSAVMQALVAVAEADDGLCSHAIELLGARLDGAGEPVRLALATVLGRIGRAADTAMVEWLLKDPGPGVRRAAVQALGRIGDASALEALRLALADESPQVRIAAARALGAADAARVIEDLERLADDADARVRAAAMRAVGARAARTRTPADVEHAVATLRSALADEGPVAMAALEALSEVGGEAAARAVRPLLERDDPELAKAAVECIGAHAGRETLDELVPMVGHPHWAVRAEVIQILGERSVERAVPAILRRLETEQDDFVRDAILRALRRLEG